MRNQTRVRLRTLASLLIVFVLWPTFAWAQIFTVDLSNLPKNAATAASAAQSVKNEYEMLINQARELKLQADQLQAELDQLKDLDVQGLEANLESMRRLEGLVNKAREIGYRFDNVGRQFDSLYGRTMPSAVEGTPYQALKKRWEEERSRSDKELAQTQAHAKEHSDQTTAARNRLYPKLNKAQNSFQAAKLQNEQLALQSIQLQEMLDLERAESRAKHIQGLNEDRLSKAQRARATKQLLSMGEFQDASAPISNGPVNFDDGAKNLVPRRRHHEEPRTENANFALRDSMKTIAISMGKAKWSYYAMLFIIAMLSLFWTIGKMILDPKGGEKWKEAVLTQFILFVILIATIMNWGWFADSMKSYIVGAGSSISSTASSNSGGVKLGAGKGSKGGGKKGALNPGRMAEAGIEKVSGMFSPAAIRNGGLMNDSKFTGKPKLTEEEQRAARKKAAEMSYSDQFKAGMGEQFQLALTTLAAYILVFFCGIGVMLIYFYVGWQIFVTQIEFMVVCSVAHAFIPFGMSKHTSFVANAAFSAVISAGVKLAVLNALVGLMDAALAGSVDVNMTLRMMFNLFFVTGTFGLLIMHFPAIASGIFSGGGSGFNVAGATMQLAGGTAAMAMRGPKALSQKRQERKQRKQREKEEKQRAERQRLRDEKQASSGGGQMPPPSSAPVGGGTDGSVGSGSSSAPNPSLPDTQAFEASESLTDRMRQKEMGPMEVNSFSSEGGASGVASAASGAKEALSSAKDATSEAMEGNQMEMTLNVGGKELNAESLGSVSSGLEQGGSSVTPASMASEAQGARTSSSAPATTPPAVPSGAPGGSSAPSSAPQGSSEGTSSGPPPIPSQPSPPSSSDKPGGEE